MALMEPILRASKAPRFGILGNHDFIEMVWELERHGLPVLLNEASRSSVLASSSGSPASTTRTTTARMTSPQLARDPREDACTVLLCHSPEAHAEAARHDFDLMLAGHTHAGQICLPGGRHVILPTKGLRQPFIKGAWTSGSMHGYTSRGTGACGVAARLNCPPEITVHTLHRKHPSRDSGFTRRI